MSPPRPTRTVFLHEYVTGGGLAGERLPPSWAAEGGAMRRCLAQDFAGLAGVGVSVVMTLDGRFADEPGPWRTVRVGAGEEPAAFARLAAEADFTLCVAPETGGILRDRAATIEQVGGRSLGCRPGAIDLAGDKSRTAEFLRRAGVAVPDGRRIVPARGLPGDFPYPAVLKPIDGAGAFSTYFVASPDALPEEARELPEALLQPYLEGTPMSASFAVRESGEATFLGASLQDVGWDGAKFAYRGGVAGVAVADLSQARRAIEAVEGLRGWVGVDFVWDSTRNQATILEINPRVTTSYIGLRRLFPPSTLARAILACADAAIEYDDAAPADLTPVVFFADGRVPGTPGDRP